MNTDTLLTRICLEQCSLIYINKKLYELEHLLPSPAPEQFIETAKKMCIRDRCKMAPRSSAVMGSPVNTRTLLRAVRADKIVSVSYTHLCITVQVGIALISTVGMVGDNSGSFFFLKTSQ